MLRVLTLLFVLLSNIGFVCAQNDSALVAYTPDYQFKDGIYLRFEQVKTNNPLPKSRIVAPDMNHSDYDFLSRIVQEKHIAVYNDLGEVERIRSKDIWGYSENGKIYVHINGNFSRLPFIGRLCHFISDKKVYDNTYYNDPYYYNRYAYYNRYGHPANSSVETTQYILNMQTGNIKEYELKTVEYMLSEDPELHAEFMGMSKRKRKQKMFLYMRKFNDRNPLLVPAN